MGYIRIIALLSIAFLLFTGCPMEPSPSDKTAYLDPSVPLTANSVAELKTGLAKYKDNTAENPIQVTLNVNELGNAMINSGTIGGVFRSSGKFVILDLSESAITEIDNYAFYMCYRITDVIMGNNITKIGNHAFRDCIALVEITIPDSVESIGSEAFSGCRNLTNIIIPDNVKSIGYAAFSGCRNLTEIIIGNSVESIGASAFWYCSNLTEINIPASITSIGNEAFGLCTNLTMLNVDKNNPVYTSENGILFSKNKTILVRYPEGKPETTFTVPSGVISLAYGAFYKCKNLTSVSMPNSVRSIGRRVFEDCYNLVSVQLSNSIEIIEFQAFARCISLPGIIIPNSVTEIKECAFEYCYEFTEITIPSSVNYIRQQAFGSCFNLAKITFEGTIHYDNFHLWAFNTVQSDITSFNCEFRNQFYALEPINGTPGIYTRELPEEWVRYYQ